MRREKYLDVAAEYGFDLLHGDATFVEGSALDVDGRHIEAAHYLIATGAEPRIPDMPGLNDGGYLTSTTAMELDDLPESLVVIGGGYVAIEQAQLFAHLGTRVTMLVRSVLARHEEPEIAVWVSFPAAATTSTADITGTFCCHVHFLATPAATREWLRGHPGGSVLDLDAGVRARPRGRPARLTTAIVKLRLTHGLAAAADR